MVLLGNVDAMRDFRIKCLPLQPLFLFGQGPVDEKTAVDVSDGQLILDTTGLLVRPSFLVQSDQSFIA